MSHASGSRRCQVPDPFHPRSGGPTDLRWHGVWPRPVLGRRFCGDEPAVGESMPVPRTFFSIWASIIIYVFSQPPTRSMKAFCSMESMTCHFSNYVVHHDIFHHIRRSSRVLAIVFLLSPNCIFPMLLNAFLLK